MYFGVMIYYKYHKCLQFDFKHELLHGFHSWQTSFTSLAVITIIDSFSSVFRCLSKAQLFQQTFICLNIAVSSLPCMASLPGVTFERVFAEKLRSRLKMAGSTLARLCSGNVLGHSHSGMSRQNSAAVSSKATLSMVALSRSTFAD